MNLRTKPFRRLSSPKVASSAAPGAIRRRRVEEA